MIKAVNDAPPEVCMRCGNEAKILPRHNYCQKCKNADQRRQYAERQERLPDYEHEEHKPLPCEIEYEAERIKAGWTDEERARRKMADEPGLKLVHFAPRHR